MVADVVTQHRYGSNIADALLMVMLPDPNPPGVSDFVITGGAWTVTVTKYLRDTQVDTRDYSVPATADTLWIAVYPDESPAFYEVSDANGDCYVYRVTIKDAGANVCEEWDFSCYTFDVSSGAAGDTAAINDKIARIAGLLGYRQRVTYSNFDLGIPVDTLVELLDANDDTIAEYRIKKILNGAHAIIGEIHQWDQTTYSSVIS